MLSFVRSAKWFVAVSTVFYVALLAVDSAVGHRVSTPSWILVLDAAVGLVALANVMKGNHWLPLLFAFGSVGAFGPAAVGFVHLCRGENNRIRLGALVLFGSGWILRWQLPWTETAPFHNTLWGLVLVGTTGVAILASARSLQMQRQKQDLMIAAAISEERAEIRREMHDVLAHRLSIIAMYSAILTDRDTVPAVERREIGEVINNSTRDSLVELRAVLSDLKTDRWLQNPQPRLSNISELIDESATADHPIVLRGTCTESLPIDAAMQRHIYRIIQEGLTNARRHGEPGTTIIELQPHDHDLHLRVTNPSQKTRLTEGNGLYGIRERARLCRGTVFFHISDDSFILETTFPLDAANHTSP